MKSYIGYVLLGLLIAGMGIWMFSRSDTGIDNTVLDGATFIQQAHSTAGAVILDVRTSQEYTQGHIAGAVNIDFYAPDFAAQLEQLDKNTPYFVYCRSGNRSGQATAQMRQMGFGSVYDLDGGIVLNPEVIGTDQ